MTAPPPDQPDRPRRPGASTFTIEGRSAPGLFVVGWLATILGLGAIVVAFMAGSSTASAVLLVAGLVIVSIGLVAGAGAQGIERRARGGRAYTGPSPFLVFAAAIPISQLVLIVAGVILVWLGIPVRGPVGTLVSVMFQAVVYIGLVRLLVVDGGFLSWADMRIRPPSPASFAELTLGAGWALPVIVATLPIALLITQFIPTPPPSPLPPTGEPVGFALHLAAGMLVAPLSEEILFRGFATTAWVRDIGVTRGVIRGALFFALAHILTISGENAGQAVGAAVAAFAGRIPISLALGWLFVRRDSIWAPLGLHAAFNGLLVVLQEIAARNVPGV